MQFDNQGVDVSGVDDQRGGGGMGRGTMVAGGGGIVGLIVTLLVVFLGGSDTGGTGGAAGETLDQLKARCNTNGALNQYNDCYLIKVFNETDQVWKAEFARLGQTYRRPTLTFFTGQVRTGCGAASSQVGPFYCPPDQHIYIDVDFLNQLQQQFGAQGRYAEAYILAHEYGHHLQTMLGVEPKVRRLQQANPTQQNPLSVKLELQADCFAGVWGALANRDGKVTVTKSDVAEAQRAAAAVGDDRIQKASTGRVNPESWTHGSAAARQRWYTTGYNSASLQRCDTFAT